jgi:hypothetical protein
LIIDMCGHCTFVMQTAGIDECHRRVGDCASGTVLSVSSQTCPVVDKRIAISTQAIE